MALAVQVRWYYFGHPEEVGLHAEVRVLSSNLRKGRADPAFFVGLGRGNADVLTVSELTSEEAKRFSRAGIDEAFPYSVLEPAAGAGGIGLWSRFPLVAVADKARYTALVAARLQVPGVRFDPLVASVHIIDPIAPRVPCLQRVAHRHHRYEGEVEPIR